MNGLNRVRKLTYFTCSIVLNVRLCVSSALDFLNSFEIGGV